jgi:hypothetical protein
MLKIKGKIYRAHGFDPIKNTIREVLAVFLCSWAPASTSVLMSMPVLRIMTRWELSCPSKLKVTV